MKACIQNTFFPLILLFNYTAYTLLYSSNNSYLIVPILLLASLTIIRSIELLIPKINEWNNLSKELITDLLHTLFSKLGTKEIINFLLYGTLLKIQESVKIFFDISQFSLLQNSILQLILAILIAEFPSYWIHRKFHEHKNFWKLHSIHHSPKRMWIFNVSRAHPFDILLRLLIPFTILVMIGFDENILGAYIVVSSTIAFLQHSNLELKTYFLNYFFVTPTIHHWHHSIQKKPACNFGHVLIIYDRIFNTFYLPDDDDNNECMEVGIRNSNIPESFIDQLKYPFK